MIDYTPKYLEQGKDKRTAETLVGIGWLGLVITLLIICLLHELNLQPNAKETDQSTPTVGTEATSQTIGKESRCEFLSYSSMEETNKSLP